MFAANPPGSPPRHQTQKASPPPLKKSRALNASPTALVQKIQDIWEKSAIGAHRIEPMDGMKGQHGQMFQITGDHPFIPQTLNENLLIKLFHPDCLDKHPAEVDGFFRNMIHQSEELKTSGLPVVKVYNTDTALTDGFLVVEKLQPFQIPWNHSTVGPLNKEQGSTLKSLIPFFEWGCTSPSSIPLDLRPSNFCIDPNGQLTLVDFMEHDEEEFNGFGLHVKRCTEAMANGSSVVFERLKGAVIQARPDYQEKFE